VIKGIIFACSVCFTDPSSASSKAVTLAVLFLIGMVGVVLTGVATAIFVWARRAQRQAPPSVP